MGTNIVIYLELFRDGKWVCKPYPMFNPEQDYDLFSVLAGVRRSGPRKRVDPLVTNRGLPHDLSDSVKYDWLEWGDAMHDENYLTLAELREGAKKIRVSNITPDTWVFPDEDKLLPWSFSTLLSDLECYASREYSTLRAQEGKEKVVLQPDQIRIVFWFDN